MFSRPLAAGLVFGLLACAHKPPPVAPDMAQPVTSAWFDEVADSKRDAVLRVHTSILLKDSVYAPLVRELFRAMTEQALHAGTDMTSALEKADEIDVVVEDGSDPVLLLRGVPANLDPTNMAGLDGSTQWRVSKTHVPNAEVFDFVPESGALYVLMDRTWIVTAGLSQQRVQTALMHAVGRPVSPDVTMDVPVSLRVPGATMERIAIKRGVRALKPIFLELEEARVELHVSKTKDSREDEVVAEFRYAGIKQAEHAEEMLAEAIGAFGRRGGRRWEWLKEATIERKEQHITVRARLPAWALLALSDVGAN